MAAKFDGKHARANMWVTHQNLARAKGGRPGRQFHERKLPHAPPKGAVAPVVKAETAAVEVAPVASEPRESES